MYYLMRKKILITVAASILALTGCASEPEPTGPSLAEFEAQTCETVKSITAGFLESTWAIDVLADENSTTTERTAAMKVSLDQSSTSAAGKRTEPYTCEGPTWERFFAESYLQQAQDATAGE